MDYQYEATVVLSPTTRQSRSFAAPSDRLPNKLIAATSF